LQGCWFGDAAHCKTSAIIYRRFSALFESDDRLSLAFALLLASIAASPVLAILDGLGWQSVIPILGTAALAAVGLTARATDVNFAARVTRYLGAVAAVPAVWMCVQLLPIPFGAHSIWINANEALNQQSFGHISIDLGATINALAFYLSNVAVIVVSLFVARDRRRAKLILFVLAAVAILATIVLLIDKFAHAAGRQAAHDVLGATSALALLLSAALLAYGAERNEGARGEQAGPATDRRSAFVMSALALLIGITGLAATLSINLALVTLFGVCIFGSIQAVRRADLPNWAAGIILATIIIAAAMVVAWRYDATRMLSPLLQFATAASADALSMAQRILSDTTWRGNGAGTYAQLVPIYKALGNSGTAPPTTAAAIGIELGWPLALFIFAAGLGLAGALYRGALLRGRDSCYPAAGAAVAVVLLGEAFCDASVLNTCASTIADAVIGLGLAQSVSSGDNF
jgi:hypothetical protein